jgi:hypothetical protein
VTRLVALTGWACLFRIDVRAALDTPILEERLTRFPNSFDFSLQRELASDLGVPSLSMLQSAK